MLENRTYCNIKDEEGNTAMMIAAKEGQLKIIKRLISPINKHILNLLLGW